MNIDTTLTPFISIDDSGDVQGIFSYGWHSEESLKANAIQDYGLKNWVVDDLLKQGGYFEWNYFLLNSDNNLIPVHEGVKGAFPVTMWRRLI